MADNINNAAAPTIAGTMSQVTPEDISRIQGINAGKLSQQELIPVLALMGAFNKDINDAQNRLDPESLRGRTLAAQAQAADAEKQYQAAATAPNPEVAGPTQTVARALSGVASVLTQNKSYIENARTEIQAQEKALLESRVQNLTRLRDLQQTKAEAAQKTGQFELEEVSRLKKDKFDKALELLMQQLNNKEAFRRAGLNAGEDPRKYLNTVIDNWNQNKDANSFRLIRDARDRAKLMRVGYANDDNTLIQILAKIVDEKTGVRENEARAIQNAAGWAQSWLNMPNVMSGRGLLTTKAREAIMRQIDSIFTEYFDKYEYAYNNARKVESMFGLKDSVIDDYGKGYREELQRFRNSPAGRAQAADREAASGGGSSGETQGAASTRPPFPIKAENIGKKDPNTGHTLVYNIANKNYYFLSDEELKQINKSGYMLTPPKK